MQKNDKIYIAGHRGLVGSALWKVLQQAGYTNLIGRTHKELDLTDSQAVEKFFNDEKPQYVFLAAAKVGGILANNIYRADFIYQNLMIQNNVIHQAWKHGVKKLLFLGSTCIYPKEAPQPMHENSLLTNVLEYTNEPYAIAKIAGIKMCESYNLQYGTNFLSVMPTNLYGYNDNFDLEKSHVLPAIVRKMHLAKSLEENNWTAIRKDLEKLPIKNCNHQSSETEILETLKHFGIEKNSNKIVLKLWGSGTPKREFLWSEDMARACLFVMENVNFSDLSTETEIRNTHINIGTGQDISIKNLSEITQKIVGFQGEIQFDTSKPDGTMRKLTNPQKIHQLGWKHSIELEQGIELLYNHYLEN